MMVLSIERYKSIVKNNVILKIKYSSVYIISAIWLFSLALSIPSYVEFGIGPMDVIDDVTGNVTSAVVCRQVVSQVFSAANGFLVLFLSYVIPQIVVYVNYGRLGYFIWIKSKVQVVNGMETTSAVNKAKVQVILMLVWAATLFTVAWIPYFTIQTMAVSFMVDQLVHFLLDPIHVFFKINIRLTLLSDFLYFLQTLLISRADLGGGGPLGPDPPPFFCSGPPPFFQ